jgi:hypothetical protein
VVQNVESFNQANRRIIRKDSLAFDFKTSSVSLERSAGSMPIAARYMASWTQAPLQLSADRLSVSRPLAEFVEKILRSREVGILSLGSAHLDSALWTRPIAIGFSIAGRSPDQLKRLSRVRFPGGSGRPHPLPAAGVPPTTATQAGPGAPHARILPQEVRITQEPKTLYTYRFNQIKITTLEIAKQSLG